MKQLVWRAGRACALLLALAGSAGAFGLDEVVARLERAEKEIRSLRFDFVQTTRLASGGTSKARGRASFERPDRFRVEQSAPEEQVVVSDGRLLWFHLPGRNQVIRDSMENWARSAGFPQGLTPFRTTVANLKERYAFSLDHPGGPGASPVLRLTPRDAAWPYTLTLSVDMESGTARTTELSSENLTSRIEVSGLEVNPKLGREVFRFRPPSGADVMDMPRL